MNSIVIQNVLYLSSTSISRTKQIKEKSKIIFYIIAPFLTEIMDSTFSECVNLIYVYAPMLNIVGNNAFYSCHMLKSVQGSNIRQIEPYAFTNCYSLRHLNLENIQKLGQYALQNCGFKHLKLSGMYDMCEIEFQNLYELETIDFHQLKQIDLKTIKYCFNLKTMRLPVVQEILNQEQFQQFSVTDDSSQIAQHGRDIQAFLETDCELNKSCVFDLIHKNVEVVQNRVFYGKFFDEFQSNLKGIFLSSQVEIPESAFLENHLLNFVICPLVKKVHFGSVITWISSSQINQQKLKTQHFGAVTVYKILISLNCKNQDTYFNQNYLRPTSK